MGFSASPAGPSEQFNPDRCPISEAENVGSTATGVPLFPLPACVIANGVIWAVDRCKVFVVIRRDVSPCASGSDSRTPPRWWRSAPAGRKTVDTPRVAR